QSRLFTKCVDGELAHHCAQPASKRATTGVVSELTRRRAVLARPQSVKFRPDRLSEIFRSIFVTAGRTRRGANGCRESFDQIVPGVFIAPLASNNQTEIISL